MPQFMSGSPEEDDQLPSLLEQRQPSSEQPSEQPAQKSSADPNQVIAQCKDTQLPRPSAHVHSHSHAHSHSHSHRYSPAHQHQSTARTLSTASSSSLGVPGSSHDHAPSRSMSRTPSREYRETLDAKSKDLEDGSRIINQYKITDTIGRGAYGTVRKAVLVDDPSVTFAVKEFGKTRLRKTHRAVNLRKPNRGRNPRAKAGSKRYGAGNQSAPVKGVQNPNKEDEEEIKDPLTHIRHEIAILKKLHHPHVVKLYEVLDDPSKDSLYMVFDYCPDGTLIDVKLHQSVEPLPEDVARLYFVQVLMGIEYLHENEIVHRDIKPDNILLCDNRKTCKIVDFGVSQMFLRPGDDTMKDSAGSPAFMSPELCTAGHAEYHGKSDDIWSFGVTLYCTVVGHLPFNKGNFYDLYESIKNDEPEYPDHLSEHLKDLLKKMLSKDPSKRITVDDMRKHPWTLAVEEGILLSKEDNLKTVVSEITDEDLDCAICKITNIFTFARAISRFKKGGSVQRARREASRSTSGGSNHDGSSFAPSTQSPDKLSRSNTNDRPTDDANEDNAARCLTSDVTTVKQDSPEPKSQQSSIEDQKEGKETKKVEGRDEATQDNGEEEVRELQEDAAFIFESPHMQTFELPPEEPDGNGPLQRNRSGPVSTLHKRDPDQDDNGPPVITMDSPRSASPHMFASPMSEIPSPFGENDEPLEFNSEDAHQSRDQLQGSSSLHTCSGSQDTQPSIDYSADTSEPDEAIAVRLYQMMLEHEKLHHIVSGENGHPYGTPDKTEKKRREEILPPKQGEDGNLVPKRALTVEEHAAALGKKQPRPKPKLLPDQPTFASPRAGAIPTPPDAAEVYFQNRRLDDGQGEDDKPAFGEQKNGYNPYFQTIHESPQRSQDDGRTGEKLTDAEQLVATL